MKPTIQEMQKMIRDYTEKEGNSVGGSLHIVLDDGNVYDSNVKFCIEFAEMRGDTEGVEIGKKLLEMSATQRKKLSQRFLESYHPAK